ncbi:ATP-dependent zinc protease [Vibrio profundum]|uniref:ATP-dependent zinc protease family protein n=1 Tax=Vibrio profundum TaxID=2910247 RepID=UPI003D0DBA38
MKNTWKVVLVTSLASGLFACSTVNQSASSDTLTTKTDTAAKPAEASNVTAVSKSAEVTQPTKATKPVVKKQSSDKLTHTPDGKVILGSQEWVYIPGLEGAYEARVDSGATTSSISAVNIVPFERDGHDWVKFNVEHDAATSKEIALPVERWVKVRQANSDQEEKRPVVVSWVEVGKIKDKTEFTLTDRTHLQFPILLGRSFLKDVAIVDVSRKHVQGKKP